MRQPETSEDRDADIGEGARHRGVPMKLRASQQAKKNGEHQDKSTAAAPQIPKQPCPGRHRGENMSSTQFHLHTACVIGLTTATYLNSVRGVKPPPQGLLSPSAQLAREETSDG